ncbi:hypothetical protein [Thalassotalea agarivorans]|uniref:Uncharacterized protein n=1 Tax=Thalassotalea agarivorans TaxID=349064 RepID=A0A1I0GWG7_THASX|nr:hypothetical protein [Thalassotalea agarivorans]SET75582.1 hypothetical protein SAMN05660429_02605 [Thalassotalea agarivorans]
MNLKGRLFLAVMVGLATISALLVGGQIEIASDAINLVKLCEQEPLADCLSSHDYFNLVNGWDGNVKLYWVLSVLCVLAVGFFSPKPTKK